MLLPVRYLGIWIWCSFSFTPFINLPSGSALHEASSFNVQHSLHLWTVKLGQCAPCYDQQGYGRNSEANIPLVFYVITVKADDSFHTLYVAIYPFAQKHQFFSSPRPLALSLRLSLRFRQTQVFWMLTQDILRRTLRRGTATGWLQISCSYQIPARFLDMTS